METMMDAYKTTTERERQEMKYIDGDDDVLNAVT